MPENETYLGSGLYASCDGFCLVLRAPRLSERHHRVALEPAVVRSLQDFMAEKTRTHPALRQHWNLPAEKNSTRECRPRVSPPPSHPPVRGPLAGPSRSPLRR
jgi:hypothetical protein